MATTQVEGTRKITKTQDFRDAYRHVMDRVAAAAKRSGRRPSEVLTVAVTKTASPDQIRTLVEMGHKDFGESRVQQLIQRTAAIDEFLSRKRTLAGASRSSALTIGSGSPAVRWHMIGHLQRNKAKQVLPLVQLVHSIDSLRLAEELHAMAGRLDRVVDVLIQVNISGETTKFGVAAPAVSHLAEQIDTMLNLRLRGLMVMAPHCENPEDARETFARTAELFHDIKSAKAGGDHWNILSMGMSDDFEIAIEEGANIVRIGRAIFGELESE